MRQVWILGLVGTAFGLVGVLSTWNLDLGPHWYPIALALTASLHVGGRKIGFGEHSGCRLRPTHPGGPGFRVFCYWATIWARYDPGGSLADSQPRDFPAASR